MSTFLRPLTMTLEAGKGDTIHARGNSIVMITNPSDSIEVSIDGSGFDAGALPVGLGVKLDEGDYFNKVSFVNTSESTQTFRYYLGVANITDRRFVITNDIGIAKPASFVTGSKAIGAWTIAQNNNRTSLEIIASEGVDITFNSNGGSAITVKSGDSYTLEVTAEVEGNGACTFVEVSD